MMENKRNIFIFILGAILWAILSFFFAGRTERAQAAAQTSSVASVGETEYGDFSAALSAWGEGDTLYLKADCTLSDGESIYVRGQKTLDLMGFTLRGESMRTIWIEEDGVLTVRDSAQTGKISGGGVRVEGEFNLESGTLTDNETADDGGAVYVLEGGKFVMTGGKIEKNIARGMGGGVFSSGEVILGGSAQITGNFGKGNAASNLYLPAGNPFELREDFAGRVGVALSTAEGTVGQTFQEGVFSDDPLYEVKNSDGKAEIRLSPLHTVLVSYVPQDVVYFTTGLERLYDGLKIEYRNANDAPYPVDRVRARDLQVLKDGESVRELSEGKNQVELAVYGRDGERVSATFEVEAFVPALVKAEVSYMQNRVYHFDSELTDAEFSEDLKVVGVFEDGREREIHSTPEATAEKNGGNFSQYYELSGSFSDAVDGRAQIKVVVFGGLTPMECAFEVAVSRYTLYTSEIKVSDVRISGGKNVKVTASDFVPALPRGAAASVSLKGAEEELDSSGLAAGIYGVEIKFRSDDESRYELMGPSKEARLFVYATEYEGSADGMKFQVFCEGGISPEWSFTMERVQPKVYLPNGLSPETVFRLTFFRWESDDAPDSFRIKILPEGEEELKPLSLFRVNRDGSTEEAAFQREGEFLIFEADELNESVFCLAAENNDFLFTILSICFCCLCVAVAAALVGYLIYRKKRAKRD